MSSSQDRSEQLLQKLVHYHVIFDKCAARIRPQDASAMTLVHEEVCKEWESDASNPVHAPPVGDEEKKAAYFAQCDEICRLEPKNTHDLFKIGFACWAAIQLIHYQELAGMGDEKFKIMRRSRELTGQRLKEQAAFEAISLGSLVTSLPPHRVSAQLFPGHASGADELGPHLIGQRIRFRDHQTGEIVDCTVQDCGTSYSKGEWYEVVYDGKTEEIQYTAKEMKEILSNRVD